MPFKNLFLILLFPAFAAYAGPLEEARSLVDQEKYELARPLLETAVKNPADEAEASLLLTTTCSQLGDWKSAVNYGENAIELLPKSSDAHYRYAVALRIKMTNNGKMKAMFTLGTYAQRQSLVCNQLPHPRMLPADPAYEWGQLP